MRQITRVCVVVLFSVVVVAWAATETPLLAQIQVTSASPNSAAEGTINLNVIVGGSGFKKGATAQWFVSGTTNPGGVTVNSTMFNSNNQLTANITISSTATVSSYDILVTNADGRSGKGTGLFSVTSNGGGVNSGCTTLGTPSGWSLVATLNYANSSGTPQYGPYFGTAVRVRPVVLTAGTQSRTVLVAAVVPRAANPGPIEIFFLNPATGYVLDGTVIVGTQVQPHVTVPMSVGVNSLEAGDIDGNGVPDFAVSSGGEALVTMGSEDPNGIVSYSSPLSVPASGKGLAIGDLDGSTVLITGASGGAVYIYQFNGSATTPGFSLLGTINDPLPNKKGSDDFGQSVALGDVTGIGANSLIVGAYNASVNGVSGAGRVFVFPSPLASPSTYYTLTSSPLVKNEYLGLKVGAGIISSATSTDVVATTGWSSSVINVSIFSGPITGNRTAASSTFQPISGLTGGWSSNFDIGDMNGDGWTDLVVGAPNATTTTCSYNPGGAELYLSSVSGSGPQWTPYAFETPVLQNDYMGFGWGVAAVPALPSMTGFTPLLLVGEDGTDLGSVTGAGQVWVYKQQ
jgi:FG-GAP repeat